MCLNYQDKSVQGIIQIKDIYPMIKLIKNIQWSTIDEQITLELLISNTQTFVDVLK